MNQVMDRVHGVLSDISRAAVWVGGLALMLSAVMVTGDVIMRKLFGITISGSDEISGYVFAAATTWAYSYCLLNRANIRIDAVYNQMGLRTRAVLDLVGLAALTFYVYLLAVSSVGVLSESLEYDSSAQTTLATPLWIPQIFWVTGLCFFLVCLAFYVSTGSTPWPAPIGRRSTGSPGSSRWKRKSPRKLSSINRYGARDRASCSWEKRCLLSFSSC